MTQTDQNSRDELDALLDRVDRLHSAPTIALRIVEITAHPEFEVGDVVHCLEHDPALAGSLLRLVNSSFFGLAEVVSSLQRAVVYLGRRSLRLHAIAFGVVKRLTQDTPGQLYTDFWKHSLTMACTARLCAERIGVDKDEAFTAALLADLGMLALAQVHTEEYAQLILAADEAQDLREAERDQYGFDHTAVTARLLQRWELPESVIAAAAGHHDLDESGNQLSQLTCLANRFAQILWTPHRSPMAPVQTQFARLLDCDTDGLIDLAVSCKEAVTESAQIFKVHLSGEIDIDALQAKAQQQFQSVAMDAALDLDSLEDVVGN